MAKSYIQQIATIFSALFAIALLAYKIDQRLNRVCEVQWKERDKAMQEVMEMATLSTKDINIAYLAITLTLLYSVYQLVRQLSELEQAMERAKQERITLSIRISNLEPGEEEELVYRCRQEAHAEHGPPRCCMDHH